MCGKHLAHNIIGEQIKNLLIRAASGWFIKCRRYQIKGSLYSEPWGWREAHEVEGGTMKRILALDVCLPWAKR